MHISRTHSFRKKHRLEKEKASEVVPEACIANGNRAAEVHAPRVEDMCGVCSKRRCSVLNGPNVVFDDDDLYIIQKNIEKKLSVVNSYLEAVVDATI